MWLRWKDGIGKENVVRNTGERRIGYVVEVEGWKWKESAVHDVYEEEV